MTGSEFVEWLAAMKAAGLALSDVAAARLLDVTPNTMLAYKRNGTDRRTALACAALLAGVQPYPTPPASPPS